MRKMIVSQKTTAVIARAPSARSNPSNEIASSAFALLAIRLGHIAEKTVIARAEGPKQSQSPTEIASSLTSFAPRNDTNPNCDTVSMTPGNLLNSFRSLFLLIFVTLSLLASGCSNDEYSIEREHWKLQKKAERIFINPDGSPVNELNKITALLSDFSLKYPTSNLAVTAKFTIARLYIAKKEFPKARQQLQKIMKTYELMPAICAEAVFSSGNSYELEDKWDLALAQYRLLQQKYPLTARGIDMPVYIAQHYRIKYQPDKMAQAYRDAVSHYKQLAAAHADSPLGYTTSLLAAKCYVAIKEWQQAVNALDEIYAKYRQRVNMENVLINKALICQQALKDKAKAKDTIRLLFKEYPKTQLRRTAEELLKQMEK